MSATTGKIRGTGAKIVGIASTRQEQRTSGSAKLLDYELRDYELRDYELRDYEIRNYVRRTCDLEAATAG
jgi:hypothetical protein